MWGSLQRTAARLVVLHNATQVGVGHPGLGIRWMGEALAYSDVGFDPQQAEYNWINQPAPVTTSEAGY